VQRPTVVLIGPAAVGKSTIAPLLATRLGRQAVDLDAHASSYYEEVGQPIAALRDEITRRGYPEAARWWQPARAHAACRIVGDHPGTVIAFGAGHSHFEDRRPHFEAVVRALADTTVIFLLPHADPLQSLAVLRERALATKGHGWVRDGVDYLDQWINSDQNLQLATHVVAVGDRDPDQAAAHLVDVLS
jgi:shikimate kinase